MSAPGPHAASAKCGKSCLAAHLQEGPSTGTWISATYPVSGEMDTYVAVPPGTSLESVKKDGFDKIILWCADVYGPRFINNQLLIDWMASQGYLVLCPDYFYKDELSTKRSQPGFDLGKWIEQFRVPVKGPGGEEVQRTVMLLREWMPEMKKMFGREGTKYGIVGYCFGAPYVIDYCKCSTDEVSAGAIVHPALLENDEAFHKIRQPLLALLAEQDPHFPPARRDALLGALTALSTPDAPGGDSNEYAGEGGVEWACTVYGGVQHGWALRGDLSKPRIRWARESAATNVRDWWARFL